MSAVLSGLAAISYDPQIRGWLIILVAVFALCGSTYLLIATNVGARLGFLLAAAGLTGWITVLAVVWTVFGIGPKGSEPTWKVKSVVAGNIGPTAAPILEGFPKGWRKLPEGDQKRAEAQAAVDETFAAGDPSTASLGLKKASDYLPLDAYARGGQKTGLFGVKAPRPLDVKHKPNYSVIRVQAVVTTTTTTAPPVPESDLTSGDNGTANGSSSAGGNAAGAAAQATPTAASKSSSAGLNSSNPNTSGAAATTVSSTTVPGGNSAQKGTGIVAGQGSSSGSGAGQNGATAQADQTNNQTNSANPSTPGATTTTTAPAAAAKPVADPTKPVVTVLMERDLGSLRKPPFIVALFSGILFSILCWTLHRRDKMIMAARAAEGTPPGEGGR